MLLVTQSHIYEEQFMAGRRKVPTTIIGNTNSIQIEGVGALGPLEAAVMEVIWREGTVNVADVVRKLRPRKEYMTVLTIMKNLGKKGLLKVDSSQRIFTFTPTLTRDEYEQHTINTAMEELVQRYPTAFGEWLHKRLATSMFNQGPANERRASLLEQSFENQAEEGEDSGAEGGVEAEGDGEVEVTEEDASASSETSGAAGNESSITSTNPNSRASRGVK